ncbi:MAG: cation:proton antiporter [Acidobacteria bacterium]|nr:cation:proton antiporter [Acidobacteriota bacterium]
MRKVFLQVLLICLAVLIITEAVLAASEGNTGNGNTHGIDPIVLGGLAVLLLIAKLGGELFERIKQPPVLGELIGGIIIGNLIIIGFMGFEPLKTNAVIGALAEIGVIILLFEVGLESNIGEMLEVGWSSLLVALAGVIAPFFLGWGVAAYFMPGEDMLAHIFIGATLCATSVGITARVLKDLGRLQARESRIILGAAVIDDVMGLLILGVVAGAINAATTGTTLSFTGVALITGKAIVFLVAAIAAGRYLMPHLFHHAGKLEVRGVFLALAISFCFFLAWLAAKVGLAPIIGAFAAGMVLDDSHYESFRRKGEKRLEELIQPVGDLLVPLFFVLMGLKVDLRAFARPELLSFAIVLTIAAVIGKQICSLAVIDKGINRFVVGLGMVPRGEVGLIFAGIGASLMLPNAQGVYEPVINAATFGVVVFMVVITTLLTPPALKWAIKKKDQAAEQIKIIT